MFNLTSRFTTFYKSAATLIRRKIKGSLSKSSVPDSSHKISSNTVQLPKNPSSSVVKQNNTDCWS